MKFLAFPATRAFRLRGFLNGMPVAEPGRRRWITESKRGRKMKYQPVVRIIPCLVCCVLALTVQAAQLESAAYLRAPHRTTLQQWLAGQPKLRLATEKDCVNKEGLTAARQDNGQNYQPYYAVGDFNRDGHEDFAVAVINQGKRSRRFSIAIFNGPFNTRRSRLPNFLSSGADLSDGGLVVLSGNRLVAGVFQTDNCVVLRPSGRTYVMKNCT